MVKACCTIFEVVPSLLVGLFEILHAHRKDTVARNLAAPGRRLSNIELTKSGVKIAKQLAKEAKNDCSIP